MCVCVCVCVGWGGHCSEPLHLLIDCHKIIFLACYLMQWRLNSLCNYSGQNCVAVEWKVEWFIGSDPFWNDLLVRCPRRCCKNTYNAFVTVCAQHCLVFNTLGASRSHKPYLFANLTTFSTKLVTGHLMVEWHWMRGLLKYSNLSFCLWRFVLTICLEKWGEWETSG